MSEPTSEPTAAAAPDAARSPAAPPTPTPTPPLWRDPIVLAWTRWSAVLAWAVALGSEIYYDGVPFDREGQLLWIAIGAGAFMIGKRNVLFVVLDFLPFALVLIAYDYLRGASDTFGMPTWWHPQLDIDKFLFFGTVPTVWLQEHLSRPEPTWFDVAVCLTYNSFFFLPYVTAGVLWIRGRDEFWRWARRFVTLSFLGFVLFALIPAAPPWAAAQCSAQQVASHPSNPPCIDNGDQLFFGHGLIPWMHHQHAGVPPYVQRLSERGFSKLHLEVARTLLVQGQGLVDRVAAVPSLHAGGTLLFVIFVWRRSRRWLRPLLVLYTLFMAVSLVYSAEHYVSDVLAGWLCAVLVTLFWGRVERRVERWRRRSGPLDSLDGSGAAADPPADAPHDTPDRTLETPCPPRPPTEPQPETTPSST